jgi:hypothetical protein
MIGIGTPISHSRMDRITNSVVAARRKNEPVPQRFHEAQPAATISSGVSGSERRPIIAARPMTAAA